MKSITSSLSKKQWRHDWKQMFREKLKRITFGDVIFFGLGMISAWALITVLASFIGGEL